jgi:hypothetical protein
MARIRPRVSTRRWRFHALAVDHRGAWTRLAAFQIPRHKVKRVMQALQRTVPIPQHEIIVHRGLRWQVFRQGAPLATGLQNIKNPVHHLTHIYLAAAPAVLGRRDQRRDQRPLSIA